MAFDRPAINSIFLMMEHDLSAKIGVVFPDYDLPHFIKAKIDENGSLPYKPRQLSPVADLAGRVIFGLKPALV
jgi:hypothetical protein